MCLKRLNSIISFLLIFGLIACSDNDEQPTSVGSTTDSGGSKRPRTKLVDEKSPIEVTFNFQEGLLVPNRAYLLKSLMTVRHKKDAKNIKLWKQNVKIISSDEVARLDKNNRIYALKPGKFSLEIGYNDLGITESYEFEIGKEISVSLVGSDEKLKDLIKVISYKAYEIEIDGGVPPYTITGKFIDSPKKITDKKYLVKFPEPEDFLGVKKLYFIKDSLGVEQEITFHITMEKWAELVDYSFSPMGFVAHPNGENFDRLIPTPKDDGFLSINFKRSNILKYKNNGERDDKFGNDNGVLKLRHTQVKDEDYRGNQNTLVGIRFSKDGSIYTLSSETIKANVRSPILHVYSSFLIRKFTPKGKVVKSFGKEGIVKLALNSMATFRNGLKMSFDVSNNGEIYVAGINSTREFRKKHGERTVIYKLGANGKIDHQFGNKGYIIPDIQLDRPDSLVFDEAQKVLLFFGSTREIRMPWGAVWNRRSVVGLNQLSIYREDGTFIKRHGLNDRINEFAARHGRSFDWIHNFSFRQNFFYFNKERNQNILLHANNGTPMALKIVSDVKNPEDLKVSPLMVFSRFFIKGTRNADIYYNQQGQSFIISNGRILAYDNKSGLEVWSSNDLENYVESKIIPHLKERKAQKLYIYSCLVQKDGKIILATNIGLIRIFGFDSRAGKFLSNRR